MLLELDTQVVNKELVESKLEESKQEPVENKELEGSKPELMDCMPEDCIEALESCNPEQVVSIREQAVNIREREDCTPEQEDCSKVVAGTRMLEVPLEHR